VTPAIIPFPNLAPIMPGQGSDLGFCAKADDSGTGTMTDYTSPFAQLVDAIIDANFLTVNGLASGEASTLTNVRTPAAASCDREADNPEEPDDASVRPDLVAVAVIALPAPIPIPVPQIEPGGDGIPDLKPQEIECEVTGDLLAAKKEIGCPSRPEPVAATEATNNGTFEIAVGSSFVNGPVQEVAPSETAVPAEKVASDDARSVSTLQQLDGTKPDLKQEPVTPSLAFSLCLQELDKNPQTGLGPVQTAASTEPAQEEATSPQPPAWVTPSRPVAQAEFAPAITTPAKLRTSVTTARPVAPDAAVADSPVSSREERTEAPKTVVDPPRRATRTDCGVEDAPKLEKVRAVTAESPEGPRPNQPTAATVRSVEPVPASTGVTSHAKPVPDAGARPATVTMTDLLPHTEIVARVNVNRVEAAQPRTAREIVVQIPADNSHKVEVQVAERGGEVRVAVRTADTALNQSLRTELGSLVARLETAGYHADTIASSESFVSSSSQARQDPSSSEQNASRGFSGQGQESSQQQGSNGQRRHGAHPDRWAEQFAHSFKADQDTGQENPSWQSIFNR
jgi:hypothetical protein